MKNLIGFLMVCILLPTITFAGNYTWTGNTSSAWNVNTNWSPQAIPGSSDTITINTTTTSLVLTSKQTIKRLVMTSDTLNLGGDTLEITGSAGFNGGLIMNGVCYPQGTGLLNFAGTTFDAEIKAKGQIKLNGGVFNSMAYFEHVGSAAGTGTGGNTFNGTTTLKNSGTSAFRLAGTNNDTYTGDLTIISAAPSGSGNMQLSTGGNSYFNGNVVVQSTCVLGISFSSAGLGNSFLALGKTLSIGGGGFVGTLLLRNFTQLGTSSHSLTFNGILNLMNSTFNGSLTSSTNNILVSGSNFYGACVFSKNGSSSDYSSGGNHFYSDLTLNNNVTNSSIVRFGSTSGDIYDGNTTFNTSAGTIQVAYADTSDFKGHITTNSVKVSFGTAGGFVNIVGSAEQILSGSAEFSVTKLLMNKPTSHVTLQKPIKVDSLLVLHQGVIKGDSTNKVTIGALGVVQEGSVQSFIDGTIQKIGNTAFTFPLGDNQEYRPLTMTAPVSLTDKYEAQYFQQPQTFSTTLDTGINYISTCNYWKFERITGTSNVNFTTTWSTPSCDVFDVDSTKLAGLENGVWKNLGLMGYTGNDSSGSYSSTNAISGYKYFTTAHQLFPQLIFEASYDASTNPILVSFINHSRGIPNGITYYFKNNDQYFQGSELDSLTNKNLFSHTYPKYLQFKPEFFAVINGDTLSVLKVLSLFSVANCIVSYEFSPNTPHPTSFSSISACYDELKIKVNISNLVHVPSLSHEMEIVLPQLILDMGILGTCTFSNAANITSTTTATGFQIDYSGIVPYNGDIEFTYYLTNCSLFNTTNSNLFNFNFNLVPNAVQTFAYSALPGDEFTTPTISPTNQSANYPLSLLVKPELDFDNYSITNLTYSPGDIVTREYSIIPKAGIINMFSLEVNLEEEVELISLEVVNTPTPYLLYGSPWAAIPPNSNFKISFLDPNLLLGPIPPVVANVPADAANSVNYTAGMHVWANLSQAINATNGPTSWQEGLYFNSNTDFNYLRIRETLRIVSVTNCAKTSDLNNSSSEYKLAIDCDKNYTTDGCDTRTITQNIQCWNEEMALLMYSALDNGTSYTPMATNDISPCAPYNYAIVIENTTAQSGCVGCGTMKLTRIQIEFDFAHFTYTGIRYGNTNIPLQACTLSGNWISFNLADPLINLANGVNPNPFFITNGVENFLNPNSPAPPLEYWYLAPGHQIAIVFENLQLVNCSDPAYDFKEPPISLFFLTDRAWVTFEDICGSTKSLQSGNDIQFRNYFNGYTTSKADPLDLPTPSGSTTTTLTFKFTNTSNLGGNVSSFSGTYNPWQLMMRTSPNTQVLDCPDLNYYAVLKLPLATNYTVNSINVINSSNGVAIADYPLVGNGLVTINSLSANTKLITWNWPAGIIPTPDLKFEIELAIVCNGSFGLDFFELEFRSTCNNSCDPDGDCLYYTYATESAAINKHCDGICQSYVTTQDDVMIIRETAGYLDENAYITNQPPLSNTVPPSPNSPEWNNVYPCDVVHASAKGHSIDPMSMPIPSSAKLNQLYFEFLVDATALPLQSTELLFNSVQNPSVSGFYITPTSNISPYNFACLGTQYFVPINNISNEGLTVDGSNRIRFTAPMNAPITCSGTTITLQHLLQNTYCELIFDAYLYIEDLSLGANYYEADLIRGLFTALGNDGILEESCDPWSTHLTYLQLNRSYDIDLTGPFSSLDGSVANQCFGIYSNVATVDGGFPFGDDFPNEFRPVLEYPEILTINHTGDFIVTGGGINQAVGSPAVPYTAAQSGIGGGFNSTNLNSANGHKNGVDKNGLTQRRFYFFMEKTECPIVGPTNPPTPLVDVDNALCNVIQVNCGNSLGCTNTFNQLTTGNTTPEPFNENIFTLSFPASPYTNNFVPSPIPITFNYDNGGFSNSAPNTWIYFTAVNGAGIPLSGVTFTLLDNSQNVVPSVLTNQSNTVFQTGTMTRATNYNFTLMVDWGGSTIPPCSSEVIQIIAHYGVDCSGYTLAVIENIENSACVSLINDDFIINVPAAGLGASLQPPIPTSVAGCAYYPLKFRVTSLAGDLSSAFFRITTTQPINLITAASTYNIESSICPSSFLLPPPVITTNVNDLIYTWDILSLISSIPTTGCPAATSLITSHFNIDNLISYIEFNINFQVLNNGNPPPTTFDLAYEAFGTGTCGQFVTTNKIPIESIDFIPGSLVQPVVINVAGNICNGVSTVNLTTTPANWQSYSWELGGVQLSTTANFQPTLAGSYVVVVTDANNCSTSALVVLSDDAPQVNLSSAGFCQTNNTSTLTNSLDNGYNYIWSDGSTAHPLTINALNLSGSVTITGQNGCSVFVPSYSVPDVTPTVVINNPSGIYDYCPPNPGIVLQAQASGPGTSFSYQWSPIYLNSAQVQLQPSTSQVYTVIATNNFGCTASANMTLNNIAPPINITPNPAYGCVGSQVVLSENACSGCTYNWSTGSTQSNTSATFGANNSFVSLTVTDGNGCQSTSGALLDPINSQVSLPSIVNSTASGATVTLNAIVSNCSLCTFEWSATPLTGSVFSSINPVNVNPTTTTTYYLQVTNYDPTGTISCTTLKTVTVVIPTPLSARCTPTNEITQDEVDFAAQTSGVLNLQAFTLYQVNTDLVFSNTNLVVGQGAIIEFADHVGIYLTLGSDLYVEYGAKLYSCNNVVWDGILADPGSIITLNGTPSPVEISDAEIAIESRGSSPGFTTNSNVYVSGVAKFDANNVSIYLHDGDYSDSHFENTLFMCSKAMDIPYHVNPYSSTHIEVRDAGTLNLNKGGTPYVYSNEFHDAATSILAVRTNLNVDGCFFEQSVYNFPMPGTGATAIKFYGSDLTEDPNTLYQCNIGNLSSAKLPNMFDQCYRGIKITNRADVEIVRNEFSFGHFGINEDYNATSSVNGKSGIIEIRNNIFYNILENDIDLMDNFNVPVSITENFINMQPWISFNAQNETRHGIYIHNSVTSVFDDSPINISLNKLRHCRTGIEIMQQKRGYVANNDIIFEVPDADLDYSIGIFRRGFRAENTLNISFTENSVSRIAPTGSTFTLTDLMVDPSLTQGTLLCGFSEEISQNNYSGNSTFHLPTHFKLAGNCQNSTFSCNTLTNGLEGFKLENAQITAQGASNQPNGNKWLSWPTLVGSLNNVSRINGNSQLNQVQWYRSAGIATEDPEDGSLQIPNGIANQPTGGQSCLPCLEPCEIDRLYGILSSLDSIYPTDEDRFMARQYLYDFIKDSLQLIYSGSVYDVELQNFFSTMALNNVGLLSNVEEMLANNEYATAMLFNEDINTTLLVENNLNKVNEICALYGQDFTLMDSVSRSILEQIAYQHPLIGGTAVYRARAILGIDVDDTMLAFRKQQQILRKHQIELFVMPNPSTGRFNLSLSNKEEKMVSINVFNSLGMNVLRYNPGSDEWMTSLHLENSPEGLYTVKVQLGSGQELMRKIVVVQR